MSDPTVEMIAISAAMLKRDHVFEMFGNLYQVDGAYTIGDATQVHAHIIAQIDSPRLADGNATIFLSPQTQVLIEA